MVDAVALSKEAMLCATQFESKLTVTGVVINAPFLSTTSADTEVVPPAEILLNPRLTTPLVKEPPFSSPIRRGVMLIALVAVGSRSLTVLRVAVMLSEVGQPSSLNVVLAVPELVTTVVELKEAVAGDESAQDEVNVTDTGDVTNVFVLSTMSTDTLVDSLSVIVAEPKLRAPSVNVPESVPSFSWLIEIVSVDIGSMLLTVSSVAVILSVVGQPLSL